MTPEYAVYAAIVVFVLCLAYRFWPRRSVRPEWIGTLARPQPPTLRQSIDAIEDRGKDAGAQLIADRLGERFAAEYQARFTSMFADQPQPPKV